MNEIDFCDRCLRFHLSSNDPSQLKVVCYPEGWIGTVYTLTHEETVKLIEALQRMEPEMCARENAKRNAEAMAKVLHDAGWTSLRFENTIHPGGMVETYEVLNDVGEEMLRLDREAKR